MSSGDQKPRGDRRQQGKGGDKDGRKQPPREMTAAEREANGRIEAAKAAEKKLSSEVLELTKKLREKKHRYFDLSKQAGEERDALAKIREEMSAVRKRKDAICDSIRDDIEYARGSKSRMSKEVSDIREKIPSFGEARDDFDAYVREEKMDPYQAADIVMQQLIREREKFQQTQTLGKDRETRVIKEIAALKRTREAIKKMATERPEESKEEKKAKEDIPKDPEERAKIVRECIAKIDTLALSLVPHYQKIQEIQKQQAAVSAEARALLEKRQETMKKGKAIVEDINKATLDLEVAKAKAIVSSFAKKVAAAKKESAEIKQRNAEMKAEREKREKEAENDLPYEKELGIIERLVSLLRRMELPAQTEKKEGEEKEEKEEKKEEDDMEGLVIVSKPKAVTMGKKNKRRNMSEQRGVDVAEKKKVEKKKKGPMPSDRVPLGIPEFRDFEAVGVALPETYADVSKGIEQLVAKKKEFERLRNLAKQERTKAVAESKKEALKQAEKEKVQEKEQEKKEEEN